MDFVPLIRQTMAEQDTGQRKLAEQTGIGKSRLGLLLHSDPTKRAVMTLPEFEKILRALGTDFFKIIVYLETFRDLGIEDQRRYGSVVTMLCEMFSDLPRTVIKAVDEINGIDGTEIRPEWGPLLRRAVVRRIADEVNKIMERRERLAESDDFSI